MPIDDHGKFHPQPHGLNAGPLSDTDAIESIGSGCKQHSTEFLFRISSCNMHDNAVSIENNGQVLCKAESPSYPLNDCTHPLSTQEENEINVGERQISNQPGMEYECNQLLKISTWIPDLIIPDEETLT